MGRVKAHQIKGFWMADRIYERNGSHVAVFNKHHCVLVARPEEIKRKDWRKMGYCPVAVRDEHRHIVSEPELWFWQRIVSEEELRQIQKEEAERQAQKAALKEAIKAQLAAEAAQKASETAEPEAAKWVPELPKAEAAQKASETPKPEAAKWVPELPKEEPAEKASETPEPEAAKWEPELPKEEPEAIPEPPKATKKRTGRKTSQKGSA